MLGEFYGLTGAISLLLDLSPRRLSSLSQSLNNSLDNYRLTKFKKELNYLKSFLDDLKEEYDSPDIKKIMRNAEIVRMGDEVKAKKLAGIDISGKSKEECAKLARTLEESARDLANSLGVSRQISNFFRHYKTRERMYLGDLELRILSEFKNRLYSNIAIYTSKAVETSYEEATAFRMKVKDIFSKHPVFLTFEVQNMFTRPGVDKEALAAQCLEWVKTLQSYFSDELSVEEEDTVSWNSFRESFNFCAYLLGLEGKSFLDHNELDLSEERQVLFRKFIPYGELFTEKMETLIERSQIKESEMRLLVQTFFEVFMLDNDRSTLNSALFQDSQSEISREEIAQAFENLNMAGFYGLHLDNVGMYIDAIGKLSFSKEVKVKIDATRRISENGYSFAIVVDDIESFCKSSAMRKVT